MNDEVDDFLAHYGVLGMKWGKRKNRETMPAGRRKRTPEEKRALAKKLAYGSAALVAVAGAGLAAYYLGKNGNFSIKDLPVKKGKVVAEKIFQEPTDIVHFSRGRNRGFIAVQRGGLKDPVSEFFRAGFDGNTFQPDELRRFGKNNEKIAVEFLDPSGRRDFSGRPIPHSVIIPKGLSDGIETMDDVKTKIWPLLKDVYDYIYEAPPTHL